MILRRKLVETKVLLVEDEPACRATVKTVLEMESAAVTDAQNAEDALDALKASEFDVVITDIKLPGMSGISLLENIRRIKPDLPVIIMTGHSSIGSAIEAMQLGAQDYLLKPFRDTTQLVNSIWKSAEHYKLTLKSKLLQHRLEQSEETFRTLFHNASDAIFLHRLDSKGNISTFSEVNDIACQRLKYDRKQLLSMTLPDITAEDHREDMLRIISTLPKQEHVTFETIHLTKNGERIPVEISAHIFSLKGDNFVLSIARNIAERREMEKKIAEASERESRRLGHEMHDTLCQDLASIEMLTSVLKKTLEAEKSKGAQDAELIRQIAANTVTSTRRLCSGLFPSELEDGGLSSALEQLVVHQEQLFRIKCSFINKSCPCVSDKSVSLHLYRIAQQSTNNAATHGKAKHISITLAKKGSGVILSVEDDGTGIVSHNKKTEGMGLHIMKYRAKIIGAVLTISKRENGGTKVECSWQ